MYSVLKNYINSRIQISETDLNLISEYFLPIKVKKKQFLLREGEICKHLWFVSKGCLRMFKEDRKGHEHILLFAFEEYWVGDRESVVSDKPSDYHVEAIEDSELLQISKEKLNDLYQQIPSFREMHIALQQRSFNKLQERMQKTLSFSAEEKYADIMNHQPEILHRVPLSMVASYLGISRETLSRIRANQLKR
ncbi:MAG: Crp/Fnr family transcriptional regulator [Chitinophagaceae bacterium]|nr:Crp/Fnr family transcriptional regulator [Chitinophagaceae bacterium]